MWEMYISGCVNLDNFCCLGEQHLKQIYVYS